MAKRTKTAKAGKPPKGPEAEPFFRPFSKLKEQRREATAAQAPKKAPGHDGAASGPKPRAGSAGPAPEASRPPKARARPSAPAAGDDAPLPVDPQTFAIYMAGVRALPESGAQRIPRSASKLERAAASGAAQGVDLDAEARSRLRSLVSEGIRFETVDDGERLEGRRLDVDPRELRRLRRGQYTVDGRIDLHGLGADEARHAVEAFVRKHAQEGDRVVLVVHGKGTHSPRGHAVLRGEIAAWLSQGRSARHIAAFATAPDDQGGTGAVLVLLAR